jgi:hypothetical protein
MRYCIPLLAFALACADALPQLQASTTQAIATATQAHPAPVAASSISTAFPRVPLGSVAFGVKYNDTEGGKRIHGEYDCETS